MLFYRSKIFLCFIIVQIFIKFIIYYIKIIKL